jgi:hypothetical protein
LSTVAVTEPVPATLPDVNRVEAIPELVVFGVWTVPSVAEKETGVAGNADASTPWRSEFETKPAAILLASPPVRMRPRSAVALSLRYGV